ncbi:MAG: phytoene dehydrogenase [Alphaproteobacteria bacterium]|nr:MAG: phytoene dehydrogenase [Alphaproteobacteria bacterium]
MTDYDAIVIGAGHNGLICAAYLARSGKRVLVLEASDSVGGLAATREFHPGFRTSVAHAISQFSAKIARDLDLSTHGYTPGEAMATVGLDEAGNHVILKGSTVSGVGPDDTAEFIAFRRMMQRYSDVLKPFSLKTIPHIGKNSFSDIATFAQMGLKLRLLGKEDMQELLRIMALPARDLMDEKFDSGLLKSLLSWDGLIGSKQAPRSPNHTVLSMLYRMIGDHGGDPAIPAGGIDSLISALAEAVMAAGAEIRTSTPVERIKIDGGEKGLSATGVVLADGKIITAEKIISAADPKRTFLDLVGVDNLEIGFTNRIQRLHSDGYVAKLHLALSGLPDFTGLESPDGRMIIAPELDVIEFAYDDAKYGGLPEHPVMEIVIPTLKNASLAPDGQHVLSAHVMYVPHDLKGGWTAAARDQLCERVIDTIARYAPGIRQQILHQELLTPYDIAQSYNVTGGHWHHVEFTLFQMMMMRPTYEAAQYTTPISGLYLASAGCHPGGGLMGGPGHNAAHEILK